MVAAILTLTRRGLGGGRQRVNGEISHDALLAAIVSVALAMFGGLAIVYTTLTKRMGNLVRERDLTALQTTLMEIKDNYVGRREIDARLSERDARLKVFDDTFRLDHVHRLEFDQLAEEVHRNSNRITANEVYLNILRNHREHGD